MGTHRDSENQHTLRLESALKSLKDVRDACIKRALNERAVHYSSRGTKGQCLWIPFRSSASRDAWTVPVTNIWCHPCRLVLV